MQKIITKFTRWITTAEDRPSWLQRIFARKAGEANNTPNPEDLAARSCLLCHWFWKSYTLPRCQECMRSVYTTSKYHALFQAANGHYADQPSPDNTEFLAEIEERDSPYAWKN